jgi:hypothetical protein
VIILSIAIFSETVIVLTQKYRIINNLYEYSSIVGYRCCKLSEYSKTESYHLVLIVNLTILYFGGNKIVLLLTNKEENYLKKRMHELIYGNESYNILYGK